MFSTFETHVVLKSTLDFALCERRLELDVTLYRGWAQLVLGSAKIPKACE